MNGLSEFGNAGRHYCTTAAASNTSYTSDSEVVGDSHVAPEACGDLPDNLYAVGVSKYGTL